MVTLSCYFEMIPKGLLKENYIVYILYYIVDLIEVTKQMFCV